MIDVSLGDIARALGGILSADADPAARVTGRVTIDSRAVAEGDLFVAFVGEQADGHRFVPQALAAGAVAAIVERPQDGPHVLVSDALEAVGALASFVLATLREAGDITVVGITGSSGKTGTKDLLAGVLRDFAPAAGAVVATQANNNNELGVPLTILDATRDTRYLVLEMGARGIGHLAYLTKLAPLDIALVLNVGTAHAGEFGGIEATAQAKGELVEGLRPGGIAVLNADDDRVLAMRSRHGGITLTYGTEGRGEVRAENLELNDRACGEFDLVVPAHPAVPADAQGSGHVTLQIIGEHLASGALAVAAVAGVLSMPAGECAASLSAANPASRWRMERTDREDGVTIINDAYNANPDSMRAALKTLAYLGSRSNARTWAVLGAMFELGPESAVMHDAIGRLAVRLNITRLVVIGDAAGAIHQGASLEGSFGGESTFVPDVDAAYELIEPQLRPGDIVLLKSSRDSGLRYLGDRLTQLRDIEQGAH
ncbi:UDP-N-acetylmuramoyl-tripeptide--D-alanyl-D-alanine ligase [Micrococcales bacterium 31B]|nr:UDP-N-acetylmuramoyl-tripeptide--D-alanyl-D-alanine ligase [Micrococcales bacterium 31B]